MPTQEEREYHDALTSIQKGKMFYAIDDVHDKVTLSTDLMYGAIRHEFSCLHCRKKVHFVSPSQYTARVPHFRHSKHESCIINSKNAEEFQKSIKDMHTHYCNRKSLFHQRWQDCFDPAVEVRKLDHNNRIFIADVFVSSDDDKPINLWGDADDALPIRELVIEFQHSPLDKEQIKQRQDFYRSYANPDKIRELLWIIDIEDYQYDLEKITDLEGRVFYQLAFPKKQNSVLRDILHMRHDYTPFILLDPGPENAFLYKVERKPVFVVEKLCVHLVSRTDFLTRMGHVVPLKNPWPVIMKCMNINPEYDQDYSRLWSLINNQGTVDHFQKLIAIMERVMVNITEHKLKAFHHTTLASALREDDVSIYCAFSLFCVWISILSGQDQRAFRTFLKRYEYHLEYHRRHVEALLEKMQIKVVHVKIEVLHDYFYTDYNVRSRNILLSLLDAMYDEYTVCVQDANAIDDNHATDASWITKCEILAQEDRDRQEAQAKLLQEQKEQYEQMKKKRTRYEYRQEYMPYLKQHEIATHLQDGDILNILALMELLDNIKLSDLFEFVKKEKSCVAHQIVELLGMICPQKKALLQVFWDKIKKKREDYFADHPVNADGPYKGKKVIDDDVSADLLHAYYMLLDTSLSPLTYPQRILYSTISLLFNGHATAFFEYYTGKRRTLPQNTDCTGQIQIWFDDYLARTSYII